MNDSAQSVTSSAPHHLYSNRYRYYVLALLTLGYVFNFVDRQVMTILIEPIKAEFGATDTQMGFLSGLAFALFYATLGIPVARLADRWSRRNVLTISMTTWSAVTALCATATGFWHLLLLRIGVGVGEAGGTPPSQSLLADYFPPEKRAFAQGILATAPNIGILVGLFGGAVIAEAYGWRTVFLVFGIPGVLLAALIQLTVKEPPKLKAASEVVDQGLFSALKHIVRLPSFLHIMVGVGFTGIAGYGLGVWSPEFLGASALNELGRCRFVSRAHRCFRWRSRDYLKRAHGRRFGATRPTVAVMGARHRNFSGAAHPACIPAMASRAPSNDRFSRSALCTSVYGIVGRLRQLLDSTKLRCGSESGTSALADPSLRAHVVGD